MSEGLSRRAKLAWTARMAWQAPREGRFPFKPAAVIERAQERRMRATVEHAYRHVPYYRETMRRIGLSPADLQTAADLGRLPLLERADLQRDPEYFVSAAWPAAACVLTRSSGSTGEPVTVFRDPTSYFADAAQRERQRALVARLAGRRLRYREALIGPPESPTLKAIEDFRRRTVLPAGIRVDRRIFATLHAPEELLPGIKSYRPDVITGYGSYIDPLFLHLRDSGDRTRLAPVVRFGSDALSDIVRSFIQDDIGADVLGSYGAVETPMIGFECEAHRGYHLNVDLCPVRLIGSEGEDVGPEETGEVVVSNLVNRGTILLNYRLGDLAAIRPDPCPCGRNLPTLADLQGRVIPWIDLGGGRRFHPQGLRSILGREADIRGSQLIQQEPRRFLLRLAVLPDCARDAIAERLTAELRDSLGVDVAIRVEFVADFPRDARGKVAPIVTLPAKRARQRQGDQSASRAPSP
jgi:phenylacetate-CoA ligase